MSNIGTYVIIQSAAWSISIIYLGKIYYYFKMIMKSYVYFAILGMSSLI